MASHNLRGLGTHGGITDVVVTCIFYSLAVIAVGLRIWAKMILKRNYRIDDYLVFAALVWAGGFACISLMSVNPGVVGMHVKDVIMDPDLGFKAIVITLKLYHAATYVWITATTLTKLSILYLYIGIFKTQRFYIIAATIGGLSVAFWLGDVLLTIFQCKPIAKNWNTQLPGTCTNTLQVQLATATINMLFDLSIVILPMPVLWRLQMPMKKKLMVTSVLSLGLVICAMNLTRVILEATADQLDFSYSLTNAGMFAGLETFIGIIVSCMPTFGPIFSKENHSYSSRQQRAYKSSSSRTAAHESSRKRNKVDDSFDDGDFHRIGDDAIPLNGASKKVVSHDPLAQRGAAWVSPGESRTSTPFIGEEGTPSGAIRVQSEVKVFTSRL